MLFCFSTPFRLTAPAIVEYKPLQVIRNYSPGFVRKIEVRSGQAVKPGQVIAVLTNDELDYELADVQQRNRNLSTHYPHLSTQRGHWLAESGTTKIGSLGKTAK